LSSLRASNSSPRGGHLVPLERAWAHRALPCHMTGYLEDGVILGILDHLGRPPGSYPESFVKIWPNLDEILRCVTSAQSNLNPTSTSSRIILGDPQEVILKFCEDLTPFGWDIEVCYLSSTQHQPNLKPTQPHHGSSWETSRKLSWKFCEDLTLFGWDIEVCHFSSTQNQPNLNPTQPQPNLNPTQTHHVSSLETSRKLSWNFHEDLTSFGWDIEVCHICDKIVTWHRQTDTAQIYIRYTYICKY
jgi:hypothetical protein